MKFAKLDKTLILKEFNLLDLSDKEKDRVFDLLQKIFERRLLDFILSNLSFDDQKEFILISQDNEEKAWHFLEKRIDGIEEKIEIEFEKIKNDLKKEIEGVR